MAMKKAAPKKNGASDKAKKAQSDRLKATARASRNPQPTRGNKAASERLSEFERKNRGAVYQGEGGFTSTGLQNKADLEYRRGIAAGFKAASQQMKQGVTKSGGYAGRGLSSYYTQTLRGVKNSKFKAEQAVKNTGSLTRNARNKKRNAK